MTSHLTPSSLTPRAERAIRRASTVAVSFVAVAAAVLSFSGLHELAVRSGFHPTLAVLFPLATDVAVAAFSLAVLHHRMVGLRAWWPWLCMMLGVAVSVAGNVWAAPEDIVSRLVHAWPPVIFALSFETVTRLVRHRITHSILAEEASVDAPLTVTAPAAAATPADETSAAVTAAATPDRHIAEAPAEAVAAEPAKAAQPETVEGEQPQPVAETKGDAPKVTASPAPAPSAPKPAPAPKPAAPAAPSEPAPAPAPAKAESAPARPTTPQAGTVREQIIEILRGDPDMTAAQIARDLDRDRSYVSKIVREVKKQLAEESTAEDTAAPAPEPQPEATTPELAAAPEQVPAPAVDAPANVTISERLATPPPVLVDAPQAENGHFETVPFPNVAPRLINVPDAKRALYEATGGDADQSSEIWTRLNLPTANDSAVTEAQLDEALAAVGDLAVARAG